MKVRHLAIWAVVVGGMAGAAGLLYAWHAAIPPTAPQPAATFDPGLVKKGAELAQIGDCQTCHTAFGGRVFAGGLAMPTPFGTIYSTNITPDRATGIGDWSEAAFKRAMREGVDREGRHLYPAFPYDHFTLTTDEDIRALYAFFMTREPVVSKAPPNALPFPINIRLVLAGWKLLFLKQDRFVPDASRDSAWNRGKYLVEGLGHCGACHTSRNLMGAEERSRAFEGGEAEGWHAYALGASSQSPVAWDEVSLSEYLSKGFHPLHGTARGPMAPVTANLADVPREDVAAMAHYLASLGRSASAPAAASPKPEGPGVTPQSAGSQAVATAALTDTGGRIYSAACASCHEGDRPLPLGGTRLSLSPAIGGQSAENLVKLVLDGIPASDGAAGPIMPGFAGSLIDDQVVALVKYLRTTFAGKPDWPNINASIKAERASRSPTTERQTLSSR